MLEGKVNEGRSSTSFKEAQDDVLHPRPSTQLASGHLNYRIRISAQIRSFTELHAKLEYTPMRGIEPC